MARLAIGRPASVTAAAVLAFLCATIPAIIAIVGVALGLGNRDVGSFIVGVAFAGVTGVLMWGGVAALRGATAKGLRLPPTVFAGVLALMTILALTTGDLTPLDAIPIFVMVILLALCVLLVRTPSSRTFFSTRGRP